MSQNEDWEIPEDFFDYDFTLEDQRSFVVDEDVEMLKEVDVVDSEILYCSPSAESTKSLVQSLEAETAISLSNAISQSGNGNSGRDANTSDSQIFDNSQTGNMSAPFKQYHEIPVNQKRRAALIDRVLKESAKKRKQVLVENENLENSNVSILAQNVMEVTAKERLLHRSDKKITDTECVQIEKKCVRQVRFIDKIPRKSQFTLTSIIPHNNRQSSYLLGDTHVDNNSARASTSGNNLRNADGAGSNATSVSCFRQKGGTNFSCKEFNLQIDSRARKLIQDQRNQLPDEFIPRSVRNDSRSSIEEDSRDVHCAPSTSGVNVRQYRVRHVNMSDYNDTEKQNSRRDISRDSSDDYINCAPSTSRGYGKQTHEKRSSANSATMPTFQVKVTSKFPATNIPPPQQHFRHRHQQVVQKQGQQVLTRKFPGPAGLLFDNNFVSNIMTDNHDGASVQLDRLLEITKFGNFCSQGTKNLCSTGAWKLLLDDLPNISSICENIETIKGNAKLGLYKAKKTDFLAAVIHRIDSNSIVNKSIVLKDITGELDAQVHNEIYSLHPDAIEVGNVILLKEVPIIESARYCIAVISNKMIVAIYDDKKRIVTTDELTTMLRQQLTNEPEPKDTPVDN